MERATLEYANGESDVGHEPLAVWDALAGLGLVAPFLTVPGFVLATALMQDGLISGDGQSWRRAALIAGVPTALVTAAGFCGAMRAVVLRRRPRAAAIFGASVSAVALAIIVAGMLAAPCHRRM